jgi:flagellar hook-associated protein 3 FlgL
MRISTSMIYSSGAAQIDNLQAQLAQTQQEIATGSSILTPADNPVAAAQAVVVTQAQADNTQYTANGQSATNSLSQETTTLQSVTTLIQNAQSAIVDAGNGSFTLQQRQDIATSLQGSLSQLLGLANAQDGNGNYLFSGYQNGSPPFTATATGAQYNGDQGQTTVQVGASQQMAISDSGDSVFQNNVTGNGTFTTAAPTTNVGSGVVSSGSVVNAAALTGDDYAVTFSGIQTAAGTNVNTGSANSGTGAVSAGASAANGAAPTNDTFDLNFHVVGGATTYDIVNATSGTTVTSGNPYVAGQAIIMGGSQVNVTGSPADGDQFTVLDAPTTYTVSDTTNPGSTTIPTGAQPYVSGQSIAFDGLQFNVTGSPSNGDSFTLNPSAKQSVFTTLTNLISLLNTPIGSGVAAETNLTNGLNTASNNLNSSLNNVLTVQASIGARLNELTSLGTEGADLNTQYSSTLSSLESVNYAQTISQLSEQQTTLTAAQQSFVKISNLSLFNYIT